MAWCDHDAKSSVCRPQAAVAPQCQSVASGPAGSAPGPANTLASLAESKQNTNDKKADSILDWHHVDHHQITSTTITWNQDYPPRQAGSPYQGRATAATEGNWTQAEKCVTTVSQEYIPSKRVKDQEFGSVSWPWAAASVTPAWPVSPAAPGMTYHTHYRPNLWYQRENIDILISQHCTNIIRNIKVFTFDIVISQYWNMILYLISNKNFDIKHISSV